MRASIAFFAGAGTVLAAIAVGIGGGYTVANIISPHTQRREPSLLERRASDDSARAATTQQAPVPYLAATVSAVNAPAVTAPAALAPGTAAATPAPATDAAAEPSAKPADAPAPKSAAASQQGGERTSSPDDANAKAREEDLKRLSDKRNSDRRQQWTDRQPTEDRRSWGLPWDDRQRFDRGRYRQHEWRDDEHDAWNNSSRRDRDDRDRDRKVHGRGNSDSDNYAERREDFDQPIRMFGSPRFRIFGPDD